MDIAAFIDHTILKPDTSGAEIKRLCNEAITAGFAAVCVPPYHVRTAKELIRGTGVKLATVIGFPFGYSSTSSKLQEIKDAIADGADELDIVHNLAALKSSNWNSLEQEVRSYTKLVHREGKIIKIIIESGILGKDELLRCCELYGPMNIDFIKTSTGYADKGATVEAVRLMREHLPAHTMIKASGGIRTFAFAKELLDAGATRLGCSASVKITEEARGVKADNQ